VGKIFSTCELVPHESYRRVYEIYTATVWVLSLVHTAGQWLPVKQKSKCGCCISACACYEVDKPDYISRLGGVFIQTL
jgi:hypothetical protein